MTTHHGTEGEVYVSSNKVAEVNDWELTIEAEFADDTPGDETVVTYHATAITRWSGRITCWYDETDTNGQEALDPGQSVTLNLRPEGTGSPKDQYSGTARITRRTIEKPRGNGIIARTIEFIGSGTLTQANQ